MLCLCMLRQHQLSPVADFRSCKCLYSMATIFSLCKLLQQYDTPHTNYSS